MVEDTAKPKHFSFFLRGTMLGFILTTTLILKNHCLHENVPFPRAGHILTKKTFTSK